MCRFVSERWRIESLSWVDRAECLGLAVTKIVLKSKHDLRLIGENLGFEAALEACFVCREDLCQIPTLNAFWAAAGIKRYA